MTWDFLTKCWNISESHSNPNSATLKLCRTMKPKPKLQIGFGFHKNIIFHEQSISDQWGSIQVECAMAWLSWPPNVLNEYSFWGVERRGLWGAFSPEGSVLSFRLVPHERAGGTSAFCHVRRPWQNEHSPDSKPADTLILGSHLQNCEQSLLLFISHQWSPILLGI
jgi:hypothetical protein